MSSLMNIQLKNFCTKIAILTISSAYILMLFYFVVVYKPNKLINISLKIKLLGNLNVYNVTGKYQNRVKLSNA